MRTFAPLPTSARTRPARLLSIIQSGEVLSPFEVTGWLLVIDTIRLVTDPELSVAFTVTFTGTRFPVLPPIKRGLTVTDVITGAVVSLTVTVVVPEAEFP